jgi:hypothetical protein
MLTDYSDPHEVARLAAKFQLQVYPSSRAAKKYMIHDGKRWIHFGASGYQDFTKHHDEKRRANFRRRNTKWANAKPLSPAWLSYFLLW